jgi:hypothetical protein
MSLNLQHIYSPVKARQAASFRTCLARDCTYYKSYDQTISSIIINRMCSSNKENRKNGKSKSEFQFTKNKAELKLILTQTSKSYRCEGPEKTTRLGSTHMYRCRIGSGGHDRIIFCKNIPAMRHKQTPTSINRLQTYMSQSRSNMA